MTPIPPTQPSVSSYIDYRNSAKQMFHPFVRTEDDVFVYKSQYVPFPNVPPSNDFSKESLSNIPSMAWMKNHEFVLIARNMPADTFGTTIKVAKSPLEWFKSIENDATNFSIKKKDLKLVALDLETTGLNTNFRMYGGQLVRYETMVGVCLAIDELTGYYLPIFHTEEDGVKNWEFSEVAELLNYLTDEDKFVLTLHNAQYDFAIMRAHGLRIPTICTDTLVISKLMNNFEFFPFGIRDGLKQLSEFLLHRKQLEIHEMFGDKQNILFNKLSATTACVYGASDGINSIGLHHHFVTHDKEGRNPWKYATLSTTITMSYIYHIVSQASIGIPIDYDHAMLTLRTTVRRVILLERKWAEIMEQHQAEYKISSNEQANIFVGGLLRNNYFGDPATFDVWATETFGTTIKHVTVGKDDKARVKTTYGMDDTVITNIKNKIDSFDYTDQVKSAIKDTLNIVSIYRSLTHDIPMYVGLIRSAFRDDRGMCFGNALTRMEGTDCLVAGTPIEIKIGDEIKTIDIENLIQHCDGESEEKGVYKFTTPIELQCGINKYVEITHFVTKMKPTLLIKTNSTEIGCAIGHRFMDMYGDWIRADQLHNGDMIQSIHGTDTVVSITQTGLQMTYDVVTNHKECAGEPRQYHYVAKGLYHHNTGRNASSKASGPMRAFVTYGKIKTKLEVESKADGNILSVNSQGMPATMYELGNAKEITEIPDHVKERLDATTREVDQRIKLLIKDA